MIQPIPSIHTSGWTPTPRRRTPSMLDARLNSRENEEEEQGRMLAMQALVYVFSNSELEGIFC